MGKIYCVYCGKLNDDTFKRCTKCHKKLDPKEHLWLSYMYDKIKEELKDKTTDSAISIIKNYVFSHLYGVVLSVTIISSAITGVVSLINKDTSYISEVSVKPTINNIVSNLSLDDELVINLYKYNELGGIYSYYQKNFYEGKFIDYNSLDDNVKIAMVYGLNQPKSKIVKFNNCEELKEYSEKSYQDCLKDSLWYLGDSALDFFTIDYEELSKDYYKVFGKEMPKEDFIYNYLYSCQYQDNGKFYFCNSTTMGGPYGSDGITKLIKAMKVNNSIILYDYYIYDMWGDGKLYKDKEMNNELIDNNIENGQAYKHIYKRNSEGFYYWYSSEPIDMIPE